MTTSTTTAVNVAMPNELVELLDRLVEDAGSTRSDVIRTAIATLGQVKAMNQRTEATLAQEDAELGRIYKRLVAELGPAGLITRVEPVTFEDGSRRLAAGEFVFYFDRTEVGQVLGPRLLATRKVDGREETFEIKGGQMVVPWSLDVELN
jgi:Arc/MetJ-type ribon-helix-helix transcriptional regulator